MKLIAVMTLFCIAFTGKAMQEDRDENPWHKNLHTAVSEFYTVLEQEKSPQEITNLINEHLDQDAIRMAWDSKYRRTPLIRKGRGAYMDQISLAQKNKTADQGCKLCPQVNDSSKDAAHFVVERLKDAIIILNRFPYAAFQLLILSAHKQLYGDLSPNEKKQVRKLTTSWAKRINTVTGCNVTICSNEGHACTGGTIPDHWHRHMFAAYDPTASIESPLTEDLTQYQFKLYEEFKALKNNTQNRKLEKLYICYSEALENAKYLRQAKINFQFFSNLFKNKKHPMYNYLLADTDEFTVLFNPQSCFLGEVSLVFKEPNMSIYSSCYKDTELCDRYITAIQKILPELYPFDGFSCTQTSQGSLASYTIRPRKTANINSMSLENGQIVVNGDPDIIFKNLKKRLDEELASTKC